MASYRPRSKYIMEDQRNSITDQGRFSLTSLASENGPESCVTNSGRTLGLVTPIIWGSLALLMASSISAFRLPLLLCLWVAPFEGEPFKASGGRIALTAEDLAE